MHHPSSNGRAEGFVQTVKKSLAAMFEEKGELQTTLDLVLGQFSKAPSATRVSAYKLMFDRDTLTKINFLLISYIFLRLKNWESMI